MTSPSETFDLDGTLDALRSTVVREHMSLEQAVQAQFGLIDALQREMGSDIVFEEDAGQARDLATVGFGGGGRPHATARAERGLARFFGTDDAVFVHGAGSGAIRAMLNAGLEPGTRVALHAAPPYKTTSPAMQHMGLHTEAVDFDDLPGFEEYLGSRRPAGLYLQHVPQRLGDRHDVGQIIATARKAVGEDLTVLVDDNYAVFRSRRLGVQLGADASAFSFFKLLAPTNIGCVMGSSDIVDSIRRDLASAGCQVQGREAMEAIRSLVNVPVALAIQNRVVEDTAQAIEAGIAEGRYPFLGGAVAAQPGIRSIVLVFDRPIAEEAVRSAWRNGSPSRSVGEEARYEFLPLFTYITSTFLKSTPGLERYAIRINPMRSGPETILRILDASLRDPELVRTAHDR